MATILESCKKHSSVECKMSFFNSFPTTFQEFLKEYGYDNIKGEAPNYSNSENHLVFFFETASALKKEAFIDKLIHISKDGKWDADSVNSFQEKVRDYFLANSELFLKRLNSKNEKEIKGFWYFFSDEPHFDDGISKKILKTLKNDTKMKSVYIDIVNKVKKENIH
ncbi:hypothetical protein [Flavobacterium cerinum]|uniref:DUF4304 domain-containing protein n=1 Tax=Flavobacterium cerinum TaxID=2502784 RepID=A0ABY5IQS4_9FLAO|nr:hypothetical protein [Flavobacterium cerinum]UUC45193.1 hypothetical protein NOX80_16400 [Flavobacterium cerinum]